jgi:ketosteroid isomerase-like protein
VIADGPEPGRWTGLAGMAAGARAIFNAWEDWRNEAEEYRVLNDERVLVIARFSARGKTSGLDLGHMRTEAASLFHVRDGQVTRYVFYFDRERVLVDVGLAPEAGSP